MERTRWTPPDPRELPEWRAQMIEHAASTAASLAMMEALRAGRSNLVPRVPSLARAGALPESVAASLLLAGEERRLSQASLYYATADMTSLALAAAHTPPAERVRLDRLPSREGLILFAEPIGGYTEDAAAAPGGHSRLPAGGECSGHDADRGRVVVGVVTGRGDGERRPGELALAGWRREGDSAGMDRGVGDLVLTAGPMGGPAAGYADRAGG
jgi:hypothetical protein